MKKQNCLIYCVILGALLTLAGSGCDLAPAKPEEAFIVYRDRMKNAQINSARPMLSQNSLELVQMIESTYHPDQAPENIAFLNILDPTAIPTPLKIEDTRASLEVRTLKGLTSTVVLTRSDSKSKWKVDLTEELRLLGNFLAARKTLDSMQEQAGEFAATWKAMDSQLSKKNVTDKDQEARDHARETKKSTLKKPAKAQKKGPSSREE